MAASTSAHRPRRILYIDPAPAVGGSVISLYQLVKGLDRRRYVPLVVLHAGNDYIARFQALGIPVRTLGRAEDDGSTPGNPGEPWAAVRTSRAVGWLKRSALGEGVVHLAGFYLRHYAATRRRARDLLAIMEAWQPDLVHLNDVVCISRAGILAARQAGVPAICHLRAIAERNPFDRRISRSLRGYICISRAVERHHRTSRSAGRRTAPSWIVYNGVDLDEFSPDRGQSRGPESDELRATLGLAAEHQIVACIGRLVPWKGQEVFIRAVAALIKDHPQVRALIVGGSEAAGDAYRDRLVRLIDERGLGDVVTMTGFRRDVPRLLTTIDLLVHASTAPEPFGRVLIEGMAAGVTVIGTDAGAVPEIIEDGITGLLVPPGDADAMAQAMARALDHPERQEAWRGAALEAVRRRFSLERYVHGVEQVYEEILS